MTNKIKNLIETLPNNPGCYQMYDKNNQIIYVGKAKNLKKRVSQYFLRPQSGKVFEMVRNVDYFDYIITKNESEAFILEFNLIHKHMPKYNILLKDDKHYPYIALKKEGIIEVKLKRNIKDKNYVYFGPYPKSSFASEVIDLVNQLFPTKKCNFLPKKPCLYYHLGQCLGYCINNVSSDENKILYEKINSFLKGDTKEIENKLKSEIQKNNDNLKFEESIRYKKLLDAIEHVKTIQTVDFNSNENKDFFAYSSYNNYVCVSLFIYRNGMLLGKDQFVSEIFEDEVWLDYEERLDRSLWDKDYFTKLTYWFQKNFAKSRIPYIKEVGQAVHQDTARKYAESMKIKASLVSGKKTNTNPTQAPAAKVRKFPVVGVIAAAAALVLVVVLLVKLLGK